MQPAAQLGRSRCITFPSLRRSICLSTASSPAHFAQRGTALRIELQRLQFPHRRLNFCECTHRARTANRPFVPERKRFHARIYSVLVIHFAFSGGHWLVICGQRSLALRLAAYALLRCTICVFRSRAEPFSARTRLNSVCVCWTPLLASECA